MTDSRVVIEGVILWWEDMLIHGWRHKLLNLAAAFMIHELYPDRSTAYTIKINM